MWNFTSLGLPFSKCSAIFAKSLPNNKIPTKKIAQEIPVKFHLLWTWTQLQLAGNPAMCLVHNWMMLYKHKAKITLISMDGVKSCHEQFPPIFRLLRARQCPDEHAGCKLV
jgi:hypothetical protein